MLAIAYIIWGFIILYVTIARGLPRLLSWFCSRHLHIHVKIGHIGILSLSLRDIVIRKGGVEIAIDSIGISSCLFSRSLTKLLVIYINDVRVQRDKGHQVADVEQRRSKPPKTSSETSSGNRGSLPHSLVSLSQVVSIYVCNVNVVLLHLVPECLLHSTVQEIRLEGTTEHTLSHLSLSLKNAAVKLLHSVNEGSEELQPCLAEICFTQECAVTFDAKHKFKLKAVTWDIAPEVTLNYGLLAVIQKTRNESTIAGVKKHETKGHLLSDDSSLNQCSPLVKYHFLIPETVFVGVKQIKAKLLYGHLQKTLTFDMKALVVQIALVKPAEETTDTDQWLQLVAFKGSVEMEELSLSSKPTSVKLATLQRTTLSATLCSDLLDVTMVVNSFASNCHADEISFWANVFPARNKSCAKKATTGSTSHVSSIQKIIRRTALKGSVELWDSSAVCQLMDGASFCAGCTHTKVTLDSAVDEVEGVVGTKLSNRSLGAEVTVETMWLRVGESALPYNHNKKHHYWSTVFFLGVILLKCAKQRHQSVKFQGMMDNIQLEWCPSLAVLVLQVLRFLKPKAVKHHNFDEDSLICEEMDDAEMEETNVPSSATFALTLTSVNLFAVTNTKACFMARIDNSSFEILPAKCLFTMEGAKLTPLPFTGSHHPCVKSAELKQSLVSIRTLRLNFKPESRDIGLQFMDNVSFTWSTTTHVSALQIVQDISELKSEVADYWPKNAKANPSTALPRSKPQITILVKVRDSMHFGCILSSRHKMDITVTEASLKYHDQKTNLQVNKAAVRFDEHNIFKFQGVVMSLVPVSEQLKVDRQSFTDLQLQENRASLVAFESVSIQFPHNYQFSEAFSEELMGVTKWLKQLHKRHKTEFTIESPLPRDLLLKMKTFSIEFSDDPFEVKLRDNFELLEDEYKENQKRWKMLDARIDELRKTHLLLPAGKVEELYNNLQKKNTDIYIQRSRQMYSSTPMRTCLGLWQITDVEVLALADLSFHGKDNVLEHMKSIDPESPFPEEGIEFNTLWCRMIRVSCNTWTYLVRDYPCPVIDIRNFHVWGRLIGAEQEANKRAKRVSVVEVDESWGHAKVERSMPPLKFYHDLSCEVDQFTIGYGPCWEPSFAYVSLVMDLVNKPSADPSPPLPFWDKMRLLYHGRLTMFVQQMAMVLHASLDPYNTTEEMDFTWSNLLLDWTNAKVVLKADLDVYVRTASKYDDCHFLHIPSLKLTFKLDWLCLADPNDHHSVMPCAPDKLPEYSSNQEHDSYRAFRSLNVNLSITMETRPVSAEPDSGIPSMLFYSSTLRWLENLKTILSGISRPIRRGKLFKNTKPRKLQLGRHYRSLRFSLSLHQFEVCYWMSFAKLRGFDLRAGKLTLSSEYNLSMVPVEDGLKHRSAPRPRAEWNAAYMNCELNDAEVWLQSAADDSGDEMNMSFRTPVEKCYFLSLTRVSYGREAVGREYLLTDTPTHRLVLYGLKGAWTKSNRDIVFSMFDSYFNNKVLRRNLSTEALKGFKVESSSTPMKSRGNSTTSSTPGTSSPLPSTSASATSTPLLRQQSSPAFTMLQQLISEAENKAMVFSEDLAGGIREQQLHGVAACQTDDVLNKTWLIELINSQVLLKGSESLGYVIVSSAKAQILQRNHQPVWHDCSLVSKTTWVGSLECMQYYATVDPGELNASMDNIMWLTVDNIEEKESLVINELPDLVGSGQGVGGVVSETVGGTDSQNPIQLQRIVSRCGCQFFYASYGENVDLKSLEEVPLLLTEDNEIWSKEVPVDSFTLTHHELNCSTNSMQYSMILDIVNNLLLYVVPKKKEASERLQRMRFQLQLSRVEDQRTPILQLQNQVRSLLSNLRRLEKEMYVVQRALDDDLSEKFIEQMDDLERQIYECKVQLYAQAEELNMMIWCFKEQQISANRKLLTKKDKTLTPSRWNEVCFKHAQWRLTEADGQLGIADIVLSNFLYSKQTKNDDSLEHLLELGYMKVLNLLPNPNYKDVLYPTHLHGKVPYERQCALRIFCRDKPPVGGISLKEHFEINVVPLTLGLTHKFFQTMLTFCFPEKYGAKSVNSSPDDAEVDSKSKKKHTHLRRAPSTEDQDDIDKMKERAEKNKMFLYIKIPEVPVRLSYKGKKDKNIEDVHDFNLVIPTLEYHNVTWTWLDLLLALKNDSKKALLSQAIKQKLQIKPNKSSTEESALPQEEDKARLLLGTKLLGPSEKTSKRGTLFGKSGK